MGEKEKLLVTSNFSFSHNVFHSDISLVHQNVSSCCKGLISLACHTMFNDPEKSFENTFGKGRKCWSPAFSPFPEMFSTFSKEKSNHFSHIQIVIMQMVLINSFPYNDTFWRPWETSLLKTLWEKEKLLVKSNFSFSHSVFYLFR